jgi:hypothetical protein
MEVLTVLIILGNNYYLIEGMQAGPTVQAWLRCTRWATRRRNMRRLLLILTVIISSNMFMQNQSCAGPSGNDSSQASSHAGSSAAHSIAASGKAISAVVAIPLSIGGDLLSSSGAVSASIANPSMNAASGPIGTPLQITDETIVTTPPDEALKPHP